MDDKLFLLNSNNPTELSLLGGQDNHTRKKNEKGKQEKGTLMQIWKPTYIFMFI